MRTERMSVSMSFEDMTEQEEADKLEESRALEKTVFSPERAAGEVRRLSGLCIGHSLDKVRAVDIQSPMAIYLNVNDSTVGPYSDAELRDMLNHREIRGDVLAWKEGDPEWTTLEQCLGLSAPAAAEPTPIAVMSAAAPVAGATPMRGLSPAEALRAKMGTPAAAPEAKEEPAARPQRAAAMADAQFVAAESRRVAEARSEHATKNMLYGALWCIGGTIATVIGYINASSGHGGGRYMVFWGAIVFGGIQFLRGLFGR